MKENILFYTFPTWHATSFKLARSLQSEGYKVVYLGNTTTLLNHIKSGRYKYVIGMGKYRKNAKNIRIETLFQNKYGNKKILEDGREYYESIAFFNEEEGIFISKTLTNGPCNRSGYFVLDSISKINLDIKFAFLHIPSIYDLDHAKLMIEAWLSDL